MAALKSRDLMALMKAYRRLSDKRKLEVGEAYHAACEWLPAPFGMKKVRTSMICPSLSVADCERICQSAGAGRAGSAGA